VIVIEFQSRDPDLAAKVANSIAENYLVLQQNAPAGPGQGRGQCYRAKSTICARKVADAGNRGWRISVPSPAVRRHTNNTTLSKPSRWAS